VATLSAGWRQSDWQNHSYNCCLWSHQPHTDTHAHTQTHIHPQMMESTAGHNTMGHPMRSKSMTGKTLLASSSQIHDGADGVEADAG